MCRRGTLFRRLEEVTENILRSPVKNGSIAITFARAVISVIQHWQSQIQQSYSPASQGILTLETKFQDIDESLNELAKLCSCVPPLPSSLTQTFRIQRKGHTLPTPVGADLLSKLYDLALTFDYPTTSPLRSLSITLLHSTSTIFLDLLTYWIGLPSQPRPFSDVKEWYNMDTSSEFFVQRGFPEETLATCTSHSKFLSLFKVSGSRRKVDVV